MVEGDYVCFQLFADIQALREIGLMQLFDSSKTAMRMWVKRLKGTILSLMSAPMMSHSVLGHQLGRFWK